jgi:hypothetical protein
MAIAPDSTVREYLALEAIYTRVISLAGKGEDLNITDLRGALDDIYNAGRDKGRPKDPAPTVPTTPRRPLSYEISDNIVLLADGGMSEKGARKHTENLVNAAKAEGYDLGYAEAKRKVLFALTGKEA